MEAQDIQKLQEEVRLGYAALNVVKTEMSRIIAGQEQLIDRLLLAMISDGHVLLEGVPGLAKTLAVKTLAAALETSFRRIQFTPDLLPADLIGTQIYNPKTGDFGTRKGPVFANIVLADEINRAPAKVQSALLEAMQERRVTLGDDTYDLPEPFLVLATQNPIEQEGTYPLPEAQVDRFLFKCIVSTPSREDERRIMDRFTRHEPVELHAVVTPESVRLLRDALDLVYCDENVGRYILDLVFATREPEAAGLKDLKPFVALGEIGRASCRERVFMMV